MAMCWMEQVEESADNSKRRKEREKIIRESVKWKVPAVITGRVVFQHHVSRAMAQWRRGLDLVSSLSLVHRSAICVATTSHM